MPDWTSSMQQTYEYYTVDPGTWQDVKLISTVKSCAIDWDSETDTLGSESIDIAEAVGECYIRSYLVTIQNGVTEKRPLGTFLVQTPSYSYDGKMKDISIDSYSPLLELKENYPDIGFYVPKGSNIMDVAYDLTRKHLRAPVVKPTCDETLISDFVADPGATWFSFINDLITYAKYSFGLDEMGRILFTPKQDTAALQPVWTYNDDNSSILYSDVSMEQDLYGIPNVVHVVYSDETKILQTTVKNIDSNSPVSVVNRGREITYRDTNPSIAGTVTQERLNDYAEMLLKELSSLEYKVTYTHAYCPVRVGDCVRLNYTRADLNNVKAKVIRQSIECTPGCPVTETVVYTTKLCKEVSFVGNK